MKRVTDLWHLLAPTAGVTDREHPLGSEEDGRAVHRTRRVERSDARVSAHLVSVDGNLTRNGRRSRIEARDVQINGEGTKGPVTVHRHRPRHQCCRVLNRVLIAVRERVVGDVGGGGTLDRVDHMDRCPR